MQVGIDFTMTHYGNHSPFLRLWPQTDEDAEWIKDLEDSDAALSGLILLACGVTLEFRYLRTDRRPMGQAYFEMAWSCTSSIALSSIATWLPENSTVTVSYDTKRLYWLADQSLLDAFTGRVFTGGRMTLSDLHTIVLAPAVKGG